jgi:hypothetical protein
VATAPTRTNRARDDPEYGPPMMVFFLLLKIVFTTVRPFPATKFLHFSKRYDDDAKRDDDELCWCAKRSFSVSRSLCLLEEDFESIDSFLSSSVYQREF